MDHDYAAILENLPVGVCLIQGKELKYFNDFFSRIFGCQKSAPGDSEFLIRHLSSNSITFLEDLQHSLLEGDTRAGILEGITEQGKHIFLEFSGTGVKNGSETLLLGYLADLSTRTAESEKAMITSRLFQKTFENSLVGMVITDKNGNILSVNPAFSKITGYAVQEVLGKNPRILKSGKHSLEFYHEMWKQLEEQGEWQGEIWNRRKNQEIYLEFLVIKAIKDPQNHPILYLAVLNDITFMKEFEENIRQELQMGRRIQMNLLPSSLPQISGIHLASFYRSMEAMGGDFYDFIRLREPHLLGIFISDVSGHGLPAALITSMVKTLITTSGIHKTSPKSMLNYLNKNLTGQTSENFLTALYAIYNRNTLELTYARASHPYPILIRHGAVTELIHQGSMMLGLFEDLETLEHTIQLQAGDKLIFYTDGLTEATNLKKEFFKSELINFLHLSASDPIQVLLKKIAEKMDGFCGRGTLDDDVCILGLEIMTSEALGKESSLKG